MDRRDFLRASLTAMASVPAASALAQVVRPAPKPILLNPLTPVGTPPAGQGAPGAAMQSTQARSFTAGRFAIEIDGVIAGFITELEGGYAFGDVVSEKLGPDHAIHKHIANVKYEDITLSCGTGMSKAFYDWISTSFSSKPNRKDGKIHACDYDGNIASTLSFYHGLITEVGFPACDAASKDAAKLTIKISPEYTRLSKGGGKLPLPQGAKLQKKWLPANFKLTIAKTDCTRVNKIEALVIKTKVMQQAVGREAELQPTVLEFPNLVITTADSHSQEFFDWMESFVIKGNSTEGDERVGTLDYLTPDLKTALFTLNFKNMGIFKCTPEKVEAGNENLRRIKAEMYVESMDFKYDTTI